MNFCYKHVAPTGLEEYCLSRYRIFNLCLFVISILLITNLGCGTHISRTPSAKLIPLKEDKLPLKVAVVFPYGVKNFKYYRNKESIEYSYGIEINLGRSSVDLFRNGLPLVFKDNTVLGLLEEK